LTACLVRSWPITQLAGNSFGHGRDLLTKFQGYFQGQSGLGARQTQGRKRVAVMTSDRGSDASNANFILDVIDRKSTLTYPSELNPQA
jgi:hypothetical protein